MKEKIIVIRERSGRETADSGNIKNIKSLRINQKVVTMKNGIINGGNKNGFKKM